MGSTLTLCVVLSLSVATTAVAFLFGLTVPIIIDRVSIIFLGLPTSPTAGLNANGGVGGVLLVIDLVARAAVAATGPVAIVVFILALSI